MGYLKMSSSYRPAVVATKASLLRGVADPIGAGAALRSMQPDASVTPSGLVTYPHELVARALAILDEQTTDPNPPVGLPVLSRSERQGPAPADLPLQQRVLSDGTTCPLPIRYFDDLCLIATFLTDLGRASALLQKTGLTAVPQEDGKAVVAFGCFQYRKTDIGPYNEVGLTILATAPGDRTPALYVTDLPVDTASANRAGREIWGYNKFVAAIDIADDRKNFSMTIRDPANVTIATFAGTRGASIPMPPNDILTFSLLEGRVVKTLIRVVTPSQLGSGNGFVLEIGESAHPMANNLRALALDGATPVLVQYADPFQSLLFPGQMA